MFILKSYSRKELAQLNFPDHNARTAYVNLRNREERPDALQQIYARRIFRKCDVQLIVEMIGEP